MKVVVTKSGAKYFVSMNEKGVLCCIKEGWDKPTPCVGIFEDRLPFLMATKTIEKVRDIIIGKNEKGVITLKVKPLDLKPGMILANRHGLRSTEIVSIV
jgi:hypothetical protein